MHYILNKIDNLQRPRLLIRAARIGVSDYRRDIHLRRHLGYGPLPRTEIALAQLISLESTLNELRVAHKAAYSALSHVDLLIAIMGEARILRSAHMPTLKTVANF